MRILFQGDSVTDAGRSREDLTDLGPGYVKYVAEQLKAELPAADLTFINRGVSGNRVRDILQRSDEDIVDLDPDVITVLIGVNDTWRRFDMNDPTTADEFECTYRELLEKIKSRTHAKIVIIEAFVLYGMGRDEFREDLDLKLDRTRTLAMQYADAYVPLDGLLAAECVVTSPNELSDDGIHPNEGGRRFIAPYVTEAIKKVIG